MKIIWSPHSLYKMKGIETVKKITFWRFWSIDSSLKQCILSIECAGIYGLEVGVILNIIQRFGQFFDKIVNFANESYKDIKFFERVH